MILQKSTRKRILLILFFSLIFFLSGKLFSFFHQQFIQPEKVTNRVQKEIDRAEKKIRKHFSSIEKQISAGGNIGYLNETFDKDAVKEGMVFLLYHHDTLVAWSSNSFQAQVFINPQKVHDTILYQGNGYYLLKVARSGEYTIAGLHLIKYQYRFSNEYLPRGYNPNLNIPEGTEISDQPGKYNILAPDGGFLFSLSFENLVQDSIVYIFILLTLYVASFLCLVYALFRLYVSIIKFIRYRWLLSLLFILDVIILRGIQFFFKFPADLYNTELFSPVFFAYSDYLPSLGDLILNLIILLQISFVISKLLVSGRTSKSFSKSGKVIFTVFGYGLVILVYFLLLHIIGLMVINSSLELGFDSILNLTPYSLAGLFAVICLLLASLFIYDILAKFIRQVDPENFSGWLIPVLLFLTTLAVKMMGRGVDLTETVALVTILVLFIYQQRLPKQPMPASAWSMGMLLLLALISTNKINNELKLRELEQRNILASHLSDARDKMLEYFYIQTAESIRSDKEIKAIIKASSGDALIENNLIEIVNKKYFQQFRLKYNVLLTLCHKGKQLNIKPDQKIVDCNSYFEDRINSTLTQVDSSGLFFLDKTVDMTYYLGRISLKGSDFSSVGDYTLFVEMDARNTNRGLGYPELLMDKTSAATENLTGYSYAYYYQDQLVRNVGKFSYEIENQSYKLNQGKTVLLAKNGYSHLVHPIDSHTILVLSLENKGLSELIAPFSFIFIFLFFIWVLLRILAMGFNWLKLKNPSFRMRLQVFMVILVLTAAVLIGGITIFYLKQLYYNKNKEIVNEKMNTMLVELETRFSNSNIIEAAYRGDLQDILLRLSNANFTDINIYDQKGLLMATSRNEIVDEGLVSELMDPASLQKMKSEKSSFFIHEENIGKYKFLSAYAPFRDINNKLSGYINIPYFARQEDMRIEMAKLVAAYVNIYLVMTALAVLLALVLSRFITRPLQLIRFQLGNIRYGFTNAKINWARQDEIGELVTQYNRMIDELGESAEMLARSERESAWREMARQVAHEIKNPLTPIKLSMQHLLKSWDDKAPDWDQRLRKFSQTLILQIDTLSAIASEFSDFAQMPPSNYRIIKLEEVIHAAAQIFRDAEGITLLCPPLPGTHKVYADENQLLRVFNNLIKNAAQAIPQDRAGIISIRLESVDNRVRIIFSDNGSGITAEQQAKIFSPNFTTKSAGMGLGLAMVKNIIDNTGGEIDFESDPSIGTTFYILLPSGPG